MSVSMVGSQAAARSNEPGGQQQSGRSGKDRMKRQLANLSYDDSKAALAGAPDVGAPDAGPAPEPAKPPRDLADPDVVKDQKSGVKDPYEYQKNERGAPLYGPNGIQASDVRQGAIADCYFAAAMAAVASANPEAIDKAIKDNQDGTFTVTFFEVDWQGNAKPHKVTVDADLPWNKGADLPAYAQSTEKVDGKPGMELWPSILEKAYAQWKGSYDDIGHGGNSGRVMEALTGKRSKPENTTDADPLWEKMLKATEAKKPMTAGTGAADDARYKDPEAGVYGWHAYTVLAAYEKKEGDQVKRYVTMRNPWAVRRRSSDAAAVGDKDNATAGGVFDLTYDEFRRLYDNVSING